MQDQLYPSTDAELEAVYRLIEGQEDAEFLLRMLGVIESAPAVMARPLCPKHGTVMSLSKLGSRSFRCNACRSDERRVKRGLQS